MASVLRANRRNLSALTAVVSLLLVAYVVAPDPRVQYVVWLVIFAVWMAWFVLACVEALRESG